MTVMKGVGGAPMRASILPEKAEERKKFPVASGVLDYFPDALAAVAEVSWHGNEQHNPGQPLHWARGKSTDEADTMIRHFLQRGMRDADGLRHTAKMVWRALALLQKEIEQESASAPKVVPVQVTKLSFAEWLTQHPNPGAASHTPTCTEVNYRENCDYWPEYQRYLHEFNGVQK